MTRPVPVGVIGCGNISAVYLRNLARFPVLRVVACADIQPERAESRAREFGVPRALTVDELLADPEIELVVNLTVPKAHFSVSRAALEAGKSVYSEKPLAVRREEGKELLELARRRGLLIGGAPDTFLGAGLQTCRKLVDDGWIGEPVAAAAHMVCHGHESWHPDPEFYYQVGGGPLFDMGPYYLTALVSLLGPIRRVTGQARISFPERTITSAPKAGTRIRVETPTHIAAVLEFAAGPVVSLVMSFDVWAAHLPWLEVYGAQGSLACPDPNTFGGPVRLRRAGAEGWAEMPLTHPHADNTRGLGVADLARALRTGRPPRASGELAFHVLDAMQAILEAAERGAHVELASAAPRPAALPLGLGPYELD